MNATNCEDRKMRTTSVAYLDRDGQRTYMVRLLANESDKLGYEVDAASIDRFVAVSGMYVTRAPRFQHDIRC